MELEGWRGEDIYRKEFMVLKVIKNTIFITYCHPLLFTFDMYTYLDLSVSHGKCGSCG